MFSMYKANRVFYENTPIIAIISSYQNDINDNEYSMNFSNEG